MSITGACTGLGAGLMIIGLALAMGTSIADGGDSFRIKNSRNRIIVGAVLFAAGATLLGASV